MRTLHGLLTVLVLTATASAHVELRYPPPRTEANKSAPCGEGGATRGDTVTAFDPGATIWVVFDETIDHPGHYRISFDTDGDDDFPNPRTPDDAFPTTLMEPIADEDGGRYERQVTLPDVECENCTLQVVQVMTTVVPYNSFYFQCADVALRPGAGSGIADPSEIPYGCCSATPGGESVFAVLAFAMLVRRRRNNAHSSSAGRSSGL